MPFALFFLFLAGPAEASRVRNIEVKKDQIVAVKTAIGVATIIQVPDRPTSLVVGDSEAFKIEYLDQAITIKPLRSNAKSNLYIYTDWRRFNVQLVTGAESNADYVVYLKTPRPPKKDDIISWKNVALQAKADDLNLSIRRIGRVKGQFVFVEFALSGSKIEIDPKWFWLTQNGKTTPIHRLLLSKLRVDHDGPMEGLIQVRAGDISSRNNLSVEVRRKKTLSLKIPKEALWK